VNDQLQSAPKKDGKLFRRLFGKTYIRIILIIIVLAAIAFPVYFYIQSKSVNKKQQSEQVFGNQTDLLLEKVSAFIELPKDESPAIATVSDKSKLESQAFFANAQNGDKVLIYAKAKKAILYRPSTNKVIEMAPVNSAETLTPTPVLTATPVN
jgi:hypothetical protein